MISSPITTGIEVGPHHRRLEAAASAAASGQAEAADRSSPPCAGRRPLPARPRRPGRVQRAGRPGRCPLPRRSWRTSSGAPAALGAGSRHWLVLRHRIGPVIRALQRGNRPTAPCRAPRWLLRCEGRAALAVCRPSGRCLPAHSGGGAKMIRLIAAAMFVVAAAAPALACELNQPAAAGSQSTAASQAQQSKPVHHNRS